METYSPRSTVSETPASANVSTVSAAYTLVTFWTSISMEVAPSAG
jgi:hypothetical protein